MKLRLLAVCCLFGLGVFSVQAQIKELNFLGKTWFLHGYDFRLGVKSYSDYFVAKQFQNTTLPSADLYNQYENRNVLWTSRGPIIPVNTLNASAVFRPFYRHRMSFIKQIEISHGLEIQRQDNVMYLETKVSDERTNLISNTIGYSPKLMLSTPTFAGSVKFYIFTDAGIHLPFRQVIFVNSGISGGKSYERNQYRYSDVIPMEFISYDWGFGGGFKVNLSCNWNFHIEGKNIKQGAFHVPLKKFHNDWAMAVQFGLRYKFGTPDTSVDTASGPSVFW